MQIGMTQPAMEPDVCLRRGRLAVGSGADPAEPVGGVVA